MNKSYNSRLSTQSLYICGQNKGSGYQWITTCTQPALLNR